MSWVISHAMGHVMGQRTYDCAFFVISVVFSMSPFLEFDKWREEAVALGFKYVASGPLVRSSYRAGELFLKGLLAEKANQ